MAPPLDPEFFEFDRELLELFLRLGLYADLGIGKTVHKDDISREQLKELLYEEIMSFNAAPIT